MERRFAPAYFLALLAAPVAAVVRVWSLLTSVDDQGLPTMHLSMWCLVILAALYLLASAVLSIRSPGRSGLRLVISYGRGGFLCALCAGVLMLLSVLLEFGSALVSGPAITDVPLFLLGLLGSICLIWAAFARRNPDTRVPGAEILPVIYLLLRTLLFFRGWSTDPIILDYCVQLLAMLFALLAFLQGAGFCLDIGKPRSTLFLAMGTVFLCAAAMMDGICSLSLYTTAFYAGCLLWQLPLIWDLCSPAEAPPKPESAS